MLQVIGIEYFFKNHFYISSNDGIPVLIVSSVQAMYALKTNPCREKEVIVFIVKSNFPKAFAKGQARYGHDHAPIVIVPQNLREDRRVQQYVLKDNSHPF